MTDINYIFTYLLTIVVTAIFAHKRDVIHKISTKELIFIPIVTAITYSLLSIAAWIYINHTGYNISGYEAEIDDMISALTERVSCGGAIIVIMVLAPVAEELIMRNFIFELFEIIIRNARYQGIVTAKHIIIVTAFLFAVLHGTPEQQIYAFICGLILGFLYYYKINFKVSDLNQNTEQKVIGSFTLEKNKNIIRPIIFHIVFNTIGYISYISGIGTL